MQQQRPLRYEDILHIGYIFHQFNVCLDLKKTPLPPKLNVQVAIPFLSNNSASQTHLEHGDWWIYWDLCLTEHNTPLLGLSVPLSRMSNVCPGSRVKSNLWISLAITTLASNCKHTSRTPCDTVTSGLLYCVFDLSKVSTHLCKVLSQTRTRTKGKGEVAVIRSKDRDKIVLIQMTVIREV